MNKYITIALAAGLMAGVSQAALMVDWGAAGVVTVADANDFTPSAGQDILSLKCVYQDSGYYFLMTLEGAPSGADSAGAYMININDAAGGASDGSSIYIGDGLSDINKIVDGHYNVTGDNYAPTHYHSYTAGTPVGVEFNETAIGDVGGIFNDNGAELEWFIPEGLINQGATVYASTLLVGGDTFDITSGLALPVPEPTSMALLALGVAALGLKRKRS